MINVKNVKKGDILSENSFFVVQEVNPTSLTVVASNGIVSTISNSYAEGVLHSADQYNTEVPVTKTELAETFIKNSRIAITVAFITQDKVKTAKEFKQEKAEFLAKMKKVKAADRVKMIESLIDNPITRVIPSELRIMKGYHNGFVDHLGRVPFTDLEVPGKNKFKLVDPRTIQYIIVNEMKFTLK